MSVGLLEKDQPDNPSSHPPPFEGGVTLSVPDSVGCRGASSNRHPQHCGDNKQPRIIGIKLQVTTSFY